MRELLKEKPLVYALAGALLVRLAFAAVSHAVQFIDSATYIQMAQWIRQWDFSAYQGTRLPGYPLMLVLCGNNWAVVWSVQALFGLLAVFLLYYCLRHMRVAPPAAAVISLFFGVTPLFVMLEAAILTEPVSVFLVLLALSLLLNGLERAPLTRGRLLLIGLVWAVLIMIRPQFLLIPAVWSVGLLLWEWARAGHWQARHLRGGWLLLPPFLAVSGWLVFNWIHLGEVVLSTNSFTGLVNHVDSYMELAQGPDRKYVEVYLKYREQLQSQVQAADGNPCVVAYHTYKECELRYGIDVRQVFSRISRDLILQHPHLYLRSVAGAWLDFWRVPLLWDPDALRMPWVAGVIRYSWPFFKGAWLLINGLFLLILCWIIPWCFRNVTEWRAAALGALVATVLASSLVAACFENSENARYGVPVYVLGLITVAVGVQKICMHEARTVIMRKLCRHVPEK